KNNFHKINSQKVANILFDWFVNSGSVGIKFIQRVLGIAVDGVIGNQTINAINSANAKTLYDLIYTERERYYRDLVVRKPELKKFLKGWLNRIYAFKNEI